MNNKQFNQQRHNRRKQLYRFMLGFQQMINYPVINTLWIPFAIGLLLFIKVWRIIILGFDVPLVLRPMFYNCMNIFIIIFPVICIIGIIQFVGFCFSIRDEADIEIVFKDKWNIEQSPILMYKKKDRKSEIIKREFYTTIPMECWQEKRAAICDRMNIHIIGDITYGGRKKNKGYQIYFESAQGRKPKERDVLYDDIL